MASRKPNWLILLVLLQFCPLQILASEKATDLMTLALKNKAAGKTELAVEQLQKAVERSNSDLQKNLALFMLGDCQLESGKYSPAAQTYKTLRNRVKNSEEQAEAIFRLMQAETHLGNRRQSQQLFSELRNNHRSSPYYELARAFNAAQGLAADLNADKPEPKPAKAKVEERPEPAKSKPEPQPETALPRPTREKVAVKESQSPEKAVDPAPNAAEPIEAAKPPVAPVAKTKQARVSPETAAILQEILNINTEQAKDELVADILQLQDQLKNGHNKPGMDETLFELAEKTLEFGETLEACKLYDQLLNSHPSSPHVERAYYEAIRLRAILGVHEAVISWAKAFSAAFPASAYSSQVKALLIYSENNGQIDLAVGKAPSEKKSKTPRKNAAAGKNDDSQQLQNDSNYQQASRKMKDGKYNLALIDLKNLAKQYPNASQVWWDLALVYVQFEDFPQAETAVKKMLAINPNSEEGNSLLGYIHYRLEDYQQAATAYDRAGEAEGNGVTFFDPKKAAQRMKNSVDAGR